MNKNPTESLLKDWRYGQTQAERLCAGLLNIDGYESVDPQSPLGGPDGLKDLICTRNNIRWIAACYFPPTAPDFRGIMVKFENDLVGVTKNNAQGFIFFVNQPLTPGKCTNLSKLAQPYDSEIYHLERIRALLDFPSGYGLRLEYLQKPMVEEEQFGFFSMFKEDILKGFNSQKESFNSLHEKMDTLMMQTQVILKDRLSEPSSLAQNAEKQPLPSIDRPTSILSVSHLMWMHKLITEGTSLPKEAMGSFRDVAIWIGPPGSDIEEAVFLPSSPIDIGSEVEELLAGWRRKYPSLMQSNSEEIIKELTIFHHRFVSIHPFLDGNGRVARSILQQQALELLERSLNSTFASKPESYFDALREANNGDIGPLTDFIAACLE